jgi:hypothetical protein
MNKSEPILRPCPYKIAHNARSTRRASWTHHPVCDQQRLGHALDGNGETRRGLSRGDQSPSFGFREQPGCRSYPLSSKPDIEPTSPNDRIWTRSRHDQLRVLQFLWRAYAAAGGRRVARFNCWGRSARFTAARSSFRPTPRVEAHETRKCASLFLADGSFFSTLSARPSIDRPQFLHSNHPPDGMVRDGDR